VLRLYADEQFPLPVVQRLRALGYDILTAQAAGQANQRIPDDQVLAFATASDRAVISQNRRDFIRLHRQNPNHAGIIVCSKNLDWDGFTAIIYQVLGNYEILTGELVRIAKQQ
jgi:predicted nuclease of predicted toxin-antitoxin system